MAQPPPPPPSFTVEQPTWAPPPADDQWPKYLQTGPISVTIYYHSVPYFESVVWCWTYISSGLDQFHQPELVITLRRRPSEGPLDAPSGPVAWINMVREWASATGSVLDPYHNNVFQSGHFFDSPNLQLVSHGVPMLVPGVPKDALPKQRLHGMAFTGPEFTAGLDMGFTRVVARFGHYHGWFPYAPWVDRDRSDIINPECMAGSLRLRYGPKYKNFPGLSARWKGQEVILEVPLAKAQEVKESVEKNEKGSMWAVDTWLHPEADAGFTWESGQSGLRAYSSGTADVKGFASFILVPREASGNRWSVTEDGCSMLLQEATFESVCSALRSMQDAQIRIVDDLTLRIEYSSESVYDQVARARAAWDK